MRKIAAWLVVLALFSTIGVSALADSGVSISPMFVNVSKNDIRLTFDGTTATCYGMVQGLAGTTKITATYTLQRKSANGTFTTLKTWSNQSVSGTTLRFSETYSVSKGYTYRLSMTATVTRNGVAETISGWAEGTP